MFETELLSKINNITKEDLKADPDCLIVGCSMDVLMKFLGNDVNKFMEKTSLTNNLKMVSVFKTFDEEKLEKLYEMMKIESFSSGKRIITQGETTLKFYVIKSGKVDIIINSQYVRTLNAGESFGERALFFHEPRSATAQANGNTELYSMSQEEFDSAIDSNMKTFLKNRLNLQDDKVELKDLEYITGLGGGSYGDVSLVFNRKNQSYYAIKAINKSKIDQEELHSYISMERSILLQIDHQFIVKLVKTLKDSMRIFFLMEYVNGKELFDVIRDIGLLNKSQCIFYTANILEAIHYLHSKNFIYRDIKPENVMVTESVILIKEGVL
jgi:cGMP-dependent protein kinase 1